ncbi:MAG: neutral zinc metallopeptidase [Paracoccaceae bacterium]
MSFFSAGRGWKGALIGLTLGTLIKLGGAVAGVTYVMSETDQPIIPDISVEPLSLVPEGLVTADQRRHIEDQTDALNALARQAFDAAGQEYRPMAVILYSHDTRVLCGGQLAEGMVLDGGQSRGCASTEFAEGPYYCPETGAVYLDADMLQSLEFSLGDIGTFANTYVLAHQAAHHTQSLRHLLRQIRNRGTIATQAEMDDLNLRLELQADCYAGAWVSHTAGDFILSEPDILLALESVAQRGEDMLARQSDTLSVPDAMAHGTQEQREHWFLRGYYAGDVAVCTTFNTTGL